MYRETGRVIAVLEVQKGISSKTGNEWASQTFVIETAERFPRRISYSIMGADRINAAALKLGEIIDVYGEVRAHEYNSNWYNEIVAVDILANNLSRFIPGRL